MNEQFYGNFISIILKKICDIFFVITEGIWIYFVVIMPMYLAGEIPSLSGLSRGCRSFLILTGKKSIKFAMSGSLNLEKEFENYTKLLTKQEDFQRILPKYQIKHVRKVTLLISEQFKEIDDMLKMAAALKIRNVLKNNSTFTVRLNLWNCPEIIAGLAYIERFFGAQEAHHLREYVNDYLGQRNYVTGVCHGDFHARNIMKNSIDEYVMIDLDCVRLNGIQDFDALYYSLECEWSKTGVLWVDSLTRSFSESNSITRNVLKNFDIQWTKGLGVSFFLDRIGQDYTQFGIRYSRKSINNFLKSTVN